MGGAGDAAPGAGFRAGLSPTAVFALRCAAGENCGGDPGWQARRAPATTQAAEDEPTLREMMARDDSFQADTRLDANGDRRLRIEPRL